MSEKYEVITYEQNVVFNYTLPGEETPSHLEREMTLVWEESLEEFLAANADEKPYKIHSFDKERDKNRFVAKIEDDNDAIIDQVDEEIAQNMKFGFLYTSPTYED